MNVVIAFSLLVGCCLATTTTHKPHHSHATHEPSEHETLFFHYVPKTHHMVIKKQVGHDTICYVATLTDQEMKDVHTDGGIRSMELKLLGQLTTATEVESSALDPIDLHSCGRVPHNGTLSYYTI